MVLRGPPGPLGDVLARLGLSGPSWARLGASLGVGPVRSAWARQGLPGASVLLALGPCPAALLWSPALGPPLGFPGLSWARLGCVGLSLVVLGPWSSLLACRGG